MGSAGSTKRSKIIAAPAKEADLKKEVRSVWLLSSSDEELLQQTMNQLREKIKATTTYHDVPSCVSYVWSLSGCHVILVTSSKFTSEILPEICSLPQVVSFISFSACNSEIPSSISKNNHFANSEAQLIDIINDDLERITTEEKSIKARIHEETINRLLSSLGNVPLYGSYKRFLYGSVNYSISLRDPQIELLRNKTPTVCAKILGSANGKDVQVHVRADLKFIVEEQKNEICMEICKLNATEHSFLKDIDLTKYLNDILQPIKINGPMNTVSCLPLNMPDGQSQKVLHVRPHGLNYKIYDHYIVLNSNAEFTVDPKQVAHPWTKFYESITLNTILYSLR